MQRLLYASRVELTGNSLSYVRYLDDFSATNINNSWTDIGGIQSRADPKVYVVQTPTTLIQRCMLMATDPGDLVLDPTCGSGTTAYVAEQWGRRWITIDTSRVALALARARIMGARYPFYLLADSREGQIKEAEVTRTAPSSQPVRGNIRHGFVYERVPHITLKSIANNAEIDVIWDQWQAKLEPLREALNTALKKTWHEWEIPREADAKWPDGAKKLHTYWWTARIARQQEIDKSIAAQAEFEYLYDKPYDDKKKVRVAGSFTVESLSPHRMLGVEDIVATKDGKAFEWEQAAAKVREHLNDAMNARNVAFLLGSGCSSYRIENRQLGVPTMKPMAQKFIGTEGSAGDRYFATETERNILQSALGLNVSDERYAQNLERLMEVLYSFDFVLKHSSNEQLRGASDTVRAVTKKITAYILQTCTAGAFSEGDETVSNLYQAFYRKLIYRDRALPRPWVFTTNYDLFNETAMDRVGIPYCNGFSGFVERRFNPSTFRYSLAEQLDISSRKWTAVDNFIYFCKLHGSVNWLEENKGLFPIRETQHASADAAGRVMIYPTPAKQNTSLASPYSDLFREFHARIVRDQSVLFVLGYSFGDEHINNILFQALTIPTFRVVAFAAPDSPGVVSQLSALDDPRIWIIGGDGPSDARSAHYFDTFVEKFMPEPPGDKVDTAVAKVLHTLMAKTQNADMKDDGDDV